MKKRPRPDRPLAVLMIGCGRASRAHLKAINYFEKKGCFRLEGLVDRDPRMIQEAFAMRKNRLPEPELSDNLTDILQKRSFDLAVIATPPLTHFDLAMEVLVAGMHLVVEKPLTLDLGQADRIIETASEKNKRLAVGMKYRYFPGVAQIRSLVQSGLFGKVLYGTTTVRWGHDQAYYDQADWFGSWQAEGGALMNQSIHGLDLMAWLMDARPVEATAVLARQSHQMEAADLVAGMLTLENQTFLLLEGTTNTDPSCHEASFFLRCEQGTIRASFTKGKQAVSVKRDGGKELAPRILFAAIRNHIRREGLGVLRQIGNPYTFLYADLMDAIREGRQPLAPGEAGRDSLSSALSMLQAGKEKRTVVCPPQGFKIEDMAGFFD